MLFIGSGALLFHAVDHCLTSALRVDEVCCPPADPAARRLRARGIEVLESADPNADVPARLDKVGDGVVLSINNPFILSDALLDTRAEFFNIHNGLIQGYRGIAEVCIFAALCRGDAQYGVTLHRLLARQRVDTGPVVAQIQFAIEPHDGFADVLRKSLDACQTLFAANIRAILDKSYTARSVETAESALSYKDVAMLCIGSDPERRQKASNLGRYAGFLSKLKTEIDAVSRTP
jgi:methionyl-tRNA formyltransferase